VSESASELYRLSDRRLSAKLVPTFADTGCRVVSATDPYAGKIKNNNTVIFVMRWLDTKEVICDDDG
jgi:hypothetical protein